MSLSGVFQLAGKPPVETHVEPPVIDPFLTPWILYVAENGESDSALPNRIDKPFESIAEAIYYAKITGEPFAIWVLPGTYYTGNLQPDSIPIHLFAGVTLIGNTVFAYDSNASKITITGHGDIIASQKGIQIQAEGVQAFIQVNSIYSFGIAIESECFLALHASEITSQNTTAIKLTGLQQTAINVKTITSEYNASTPYANGEQTLMLVACSGDVYIRCTLLQSFAKSGAILITGSNQLNFHMTGSVSYGCFLANENYQAGLRIESGNNSNIIFDGVIHAAGAPCILLNDAAGDRTEFTAKGFLYNHDFPAVECYNQTITTLIESTIVSGEYCDRPAISVGDSLHPFYTGQGKVIFSGRLFKRTMDGILVDNGILQLNHATIICENRSSFSVFTNLEEVNIICMSSHSNSPYSPNISCRHESLNVTSYPI